MRIVRASILPEIANIHKDVHLFVLVRYHSIFKQLFRLLRFSKLINYSFEFNGISLIWDLYFHFILFILSLVCSSLPIRYRCVEYFHLHFIIIALITFSH